MEGKYNLNEMNTQFRRLKELAKTNPDVEDFFKFERLIKYMEEKSGSGKNPSPLKKRSPSKSSEAQTQAPKKKQLNIDPKLVEVLDDSDPADNIINDQQSKLQEIRTNELVLDHFLTTILSKRTLTIMGFNFIQYFLRSIIVSRTFTSNDVYTLYNRNPATLDMNLKL